MCYSRNTDKLDHLATSANGVLSNQSLRQVIDRRETPGSSDLLHAANRPLDSAIRPLISANTRYYHLDGSRDTDSAIAFLASDGIRAPLVDVGSRSDDIETQWAARIVSLLRQRVRLNGGRGPGENDDFRIVEDVDGRWMVRLRTGETPTDIVTGSMLGVPYLDDEASTLADAIEISTPGSQSPHSTAPTSHRRLLGRAEANVRLHSIITRVNIFRGFPYESTRLQPQYFSALDDIERLAGRIRRLPPGISDDTFDLFEAWLNDLERSSSRARPHQQQQPGSPVTRQEEEPHLEINWINPAYPQTPTLFSPSPPRRLQPRAFSISIASLSPPTSTSTAPFPTHLQMQNIVSTLKSMIQSPDLPSRATFSAVRRAFDTITTHLESHPPPLLSNAVLELVETAQSSFWILARRAFPGALPASDARLAICAARRERDRQMGRRVSAWF
jgi:hypothetical protein